MKKKTCKRCQLEKPADDEHFYVSKVVKGVQYLATLCKPCQVAQNHENDANRREKNYLRLWQWFESHPCVDCGEDNPLKLQLDHVVGEKHHNVSEIMKFSWQRIGRELAKCVTRCANCHQVKTSAERGNYATEQLRDYVTKWPENKRAFYIHEEETE